MFASLPRFVSKRITQQAASRRFLCTFPQQSKVVSRHQVAQSQCIQFPCRTYSTEQDSEKQQPQNDEQQQAPSQQNEAQSQQKSSPAKPHYMKYPTVAILLSGCGAFDGSDVLEASALSLQLYNYGIRPVYYAPTETEIGLVVNHSTKVEDPVEERFAYKESARIGREIESLSKLDASNHLALFIPSGEGAVQTLSDISTMSEELEWSEVNEDADIAVKEFHSAKKPIVSFGQASVLVAQILGTLRGGPGVSVTTGSTHGDWVEAVGSEFENTKEILVDKENHIVSLGGATDNRNNINPAGIMDLCGDVLETLKKEYLADRSDIHKDKYLEDTKQ